MSLPPRSLQLLIPYAHVNDPQCVLVATSLSLPWLTQLLRGLMLVDTVTGSPDDLSPPHERLRARALGLDAPDGQIPWAALELARSGQQPGATGQAWVTPAHWQIGTNQVLMLDPDSLQLQEAESRTLMQAMAPYFAQDGIELTFQSAQRWLATGDTLADLPSASLDRVRGADVRPWMPSRATLRRLQNEMQMLLYTHPVNDTRTERGHMAVNSFWVSGSGRWAGLPPAATEPILATDLRQSALLGDWQSWAQAWQQIDQNACRSLLDQMQAGLPVSLVLCSERNALVFEARNNRWGDRLRRRFRVASLQQFTPLL
ncbi:MAG: phosphoglycerate mutase [Burkholderiaceae bacterium]